MNYLALFALALFFIITFAWSAVAYFFFIKDGRRSVAKKYPNIYYAIFIIASFALLFIITFALEHFLSSIIPDDIGSYSEDENWITLSFSIASTVGTISSIFFLCISDKYFDLQDKHDELLRVNKYTKEDSIKVWEDNSNLKIKITSLEKQLTAIKRKEAKKPKP